MALATLKQLTPAATGRSFPIGATLVDGGANFSLFSRSAAGIELLFFDRVDDARPSRVIPIDPFVSRTYHYWHVFVPGVQAGQVYGFRAYGPFEPDRGLRFDPSKLLLDPYARAVGGAADDGASDRPGEAGQVVEAGQRQRGRKNVGYKGREIERKRDQRSNAHSTNHKCNESLLD